MLEKGGRRGQRQVPSGVALEQQSVCVERGIKIRMVSARSRGVSCERGEGGKLCL